MEVATSADRESDTELRVLFRRAELCLAESRGMILMLQLGSMHLEWLPEIQAEHIETAHRYGGPRPFVALCKLDPRYPLEINYDADLFELKRALDRALPYFAACAVIVGFGGFLGVTMHRSLRLLGMLSRHNPPMNAFASRVEAMRWIEPYAELAVTGEFDPAHFLRALRAMEALLGCEE